MTTTSQAPTTQQILMQIGSGYWASQILSVATRLDVLEKLPASSCILAQEPGYHHDSVGATASFWGRCSSRPRVRAVSFTIWSLYWPAPMAN